MLNTNGLRRTPYTGPKFRLNALAQAKLLRLLYDGPPKGWRELCELTGLGEVALRSYIAHLRALRLVRVGDWGRAPNGAYVRELYEWAPDMPDVPQPKKSPAQRSRESRARKKQRLSTAGIAAMIGIASTLKESAYNDSSNTRTTGREPKRVQPAKSAVRMGGDNGKAQSANAAASAVRDSERRQT